MVMRVNYHVGLLWLTFYFFLFRGFELVSEKLWTFSSHWAGGDCRAAQFCNKTPSSGWNKRYFQHTYWMKQLFVKMVNLINDAVAHYYHPKMIKIDWALQDLLTSVSSSAPVYPQWRHQPDIQQQALVFSTSALLSTHTVEVEGERSGAASGQGAMSVGVLHKIISTRASNEAPN